MSDIDEKLTDLFDQLDDWFIDITFDEPICQFKLEDEEGKVPSSYRPVTSNLNPTKQRKRQCNQPRKSPKSLESLAKDLERLLDDDELKQENNGEPKEPEYYLYNLYLNDELALLDSTIGNSCTLKFRDRKINKERDEFTVVVYGNGNECNDQMILSNNYNKTTRDLKSHAHVSTPLDHDYPLKPPPTKPLLTNHELIRTLDQRRNTRNTKSSPSSVLALEVLKRFARFSDKFETLLKQS